MILAFSLAAATTLPTVSVSPISERTATVGAALGGLAVGGATSGIVYWQTKHTTLAVPERTIIAALAGTIVGGLTWWGLSALLHSFTPQGKLLAAQKIIAQAEYDALISRNFTTSDELLNAVNIRFGTTWPLVLAREHFINMNRNLALAASMLISAEQEATRDGGFAIASACKEYQARIPALIKTIEIYMTNIVHDPAYEAQVKNYEKHQEAERQRLHEAKAKAEDRWHESREKQKDREFKQQIVNSNPQRPMMVSV